MRGWKVCIVAIWMGEVGRLFERPRAKVGQDGKGRLGEAKRWGLWESLQKASWDMVGLGGVGGFGWSWAGLSWVG